MLPCYVARLIVALRPWLFNRLLLQTMNSLFLTTWNPSSVFGWQIHHQSNGDVKKDFDDVGCSLFVRTYVPCIIVANCCTSSRVESRVTSIAHSMAKEDPSDQTSGALRSTIRHSGKERTHPIKCLNLWVRPARFIVNPDRCQLITYRGSLCILA